MRAPDSNAFIQWLHDIGIHLKADAVQGMSEATSDAVAQMDMPALLALAAALGWASGLRLYALTFLVGLAGALDWLVLPAGLHVLQHPMVIAVSGFMLMVEFCADKIPWIDSAWDAVHAFIRVPAGALLAAGVFGADNATMGVAAGLMGGSLAATSFATKATVRAAINTSPEPFSNWGASLMEDGLVIAAVWLATQHPVVFGIALVVMVLLSVVLVALLFRFFKAVLRRLRHQPHEVPA